MNPEQRNMDDVLKDKFLSFEVDIPLSDWKNIEEKLDHKRRFGWIWWAAIPLLIMCGLGLYSIFYTPSFTDKSEKPLQQKSTSSSSIEKIDQIHVKSISKSPISNPINKQSSRIIESASKKQKKDNSTETAPLPIPFNFDAIDLQSRLGLNLWKAHPPQVERIKDISLSTKKRFNTRLFSFEFGLNFAPAMGLDAIANNKSDFLNRSYLKNITNSSNFGSGFNNGIHAQVNIGKSWYIRSGFYSSTYRVNHSYKFTITEAPNVTLGKGITYYIPLDPSEQKQINHSGSSSLTYISIPLFIGNRMELTKKWGLESKIGFNLSYLQKSDGQIINPTYLNLENINKDNAIKKWNEGLCVSTGFYYKTNKNLIFTVEPNYSTLIGSAQIKDYPVKTRFYNYGLNINVNYILGKKN